MPLDGYSQGGSASARGVWSLVSEATEKRKGIKISEVGGFDYVGGFACTSERSYWGAEGVG